MNRGDIALLAQLMSGMRDAARELEIAQKKKDIEKFNAIKKEIMYFQSKIDSLI